MPDGTVRLVVTAADVGRVVGLLQPTGLAPFLYPADRRVVVDDEEVRVDVGGGTGGEYIPSGK